MIKTHLHKRIVDCYDQVQDWFSKKSQGVQFPFYSSFDLRDSSVKITPVDANLFPAGFNNICEVDREGAVPICANYLKKYFPDVKNIILLVEEHTQNPFYWDNIYTLKTLLEKSGVLSVSVCAPGKNITKNTQLISAQGHPIDVALLKNKIKKADLIISNNDFSTDYQLDFSLPITPPVCAGWKVRRKHSFFKEYNLLAEEFARLIEVDPGFLTIKTKRFVDFQINDSECLERLKSEVDLFLSELEEEQKTSISFEGIGERAEGSEEQKPFLFLKNNSGTYGLGMTTISSSQDIDQWNYKVRKRMKAVKGGGQVTELIIQEGIASHLKKEGFVAEPAVYFIGCCLTGGFLRTHKKKGTRDNLNSPGAVYRTLCISDLEVEVEGKPMENVYGWIGHLAVLATAYELQALAKK